MLFNSLEFIFLFLPITACIYHGLRKLENHSLSVYWLVSASLFFYGWWNPNYLIIIIASIIVNFSFGNILSRHRNHGLLVAFICINLVSIGYFKYFNFFIDNYNDLFHQGITVDQIILPLAISFFTFQQITFLVDSYKGQTKHYDFIQYCLFVTFFPQLIAGPIVHHKEMMPQFNMLPNRNTIDSRVALGVTIFAIGLFKKVVLADNLAIHATPYFEAVGNGSVLTIYEAWIATLAYTFQLYFDFSGYSDMAVGAANLFGIRLPMNFFSPYKSTSIIEFWRRWHMTLSRFLRDYLYYPLGGNRKGSARRYTNLLITMLLGGLWHGAGWTFVIWGGLHGLFLITNHAFRAFCGNKKPNPSPNPSTTQKVASKLLALLSITLTFICVASAWVFFRADSFQSAVSILQSMYAINGITVPRLLESVLGSFGGDYFSFGLLFVHNLSIPTESIKLILLSMFIVFVLPNAYQITTKLQATCDTLHQQPSFIKWRPNTLWAFLTMIFFVSSLLLANKVSEFLYFQF